MGGEERGEVGAGDGVGLDRDVGLGFGRLWLGMGWDGMGKSR